MARATIPKLLDRVVVLANKYKDYFELLGSPQRKHTTVYNENVGHAKYWSDDSKDTYWEVKFECRDIITGCLAITQFKTDHPVIECNVNDINYETLLNLITIFNKELKLKYKQFKLKK